MVTQQSTKQSLQPLLAKIPPLIVRSFEALSIRGGPTILRLLSKLPSVRRIEATVQLPAGQLIRFPAFDHYWARYLWAQVPYEPDVELIFRKLGKSRALIDCGANIGYWSVRAHDFGFTRVVAIEANRNLMPFLEQNLKMNRVNGVAKHAAIYSRSGEELLLQGTEEHAVAGIGTSGLPVTSVTIADIAKDIPTDQGIVAKLDVEGAEVAALEGAAGRENIIFVYEDFPQHDMRVTDYLLKSGMRVFGVAPSGEDCRIESVKFALSFNARTAPRGGPSNLVACRAENAASVEAALRSSGLRDA